MNNEELDPYESTNKYKAYIGDGVYMELDDNTCELLLKTKRGNIWHYIYLDHITLDNLNKISDQWKKEINL